MSTARILGPPPSSPAPQCNHEPPPEATALDLLQIAERAMERLAEIEGVTEASGFVAMYGGRAKVSLHGDGRALGPDARPDLSEFYEQYDAVVPESFRQKYPLRGRPDSRD